MNPEPNEEQVQQLRKAFLDKISNSDEHSFHPKDLERIKTDDFWLKRFLFHSECNQDNAIAMMLSSLKWRKESEANDIKEKVKNEILIAGGFFPRGRDIDGAIIFIFKCNKYVKNEYDTEDIKKCVIYWMERLEKESKGQPITLFFDMQGCGLKNMDLEFTRYLIGLFKDYYPYFLNYVLVFEMPYLFNAVFKVIKSWLPEKAVKKIKFVSKKDIKDWVPLDQALTCWGGKDDYTFSFVPEETDSVCLNNNNNNNRKVRFEEGTTAQMSEQSSTITAKSVEDGALLSVYPEAIIRFTKDQEDYVCTLTVRNISTNHVTFKVKTTAPEKFRVRHGYGCLEPNKETTITVCLLDPYKASYVGKDKFLIMSAIIDNPNVGTDDLTDLWKTLTVRKEHQIHLKCAPLTSSKEQHQHQQNSIMSGGGSSGSSDPMDLKSIHETLKEVKSERKKIQADIKLLLYGQLVLIIMIMANFFTSYYSMFSSYK